MLPRQKRTRERSFHLRSQAVAEIFLRFSRSDDKRVERDGADAESHHQRDDFSGKDSHGSCPFFLLRLLPLSLPWIHWD